VDDRRTAGVQELSVSLGQAGGQSQLEQRVG